MNCAMMTIELVHGKMASARTKIGRQVVHGGGELVVVSPMVLSPLPKKVAAAVIGTKTKKIAITRLIPSFPSGPLPTLSPSNLL